MDLIKNWKIHVFALLLVIVAEFIGIQKHGLVIFLPMLYALVLGGIISYPSFHILNEKQMTRAGNLMGITMLFLIAKIGLGIGPNLHLLLNSGLALIMQEFGHFFGTLIFGLPTAILLKMGREAIGACYSIDREANVAIIAEKFGIFAVASWACTSAAPSSGHSGFPFSPASYPVRESSIPTRWLWAVASVLPA